MVGVGLDPRHAALVSQLLALLVDLLRQMGYIEEVYVLEAVCLPQLGLSGEDVLLGGGVEVHGGCQRVLGLFAAVHVVAAGIHVAQTLDGFLSGHNGSSFFHNGFLTRQAFFKGSFTVKTTKVPQGKSCVSVKLPQKRACLKDRF